MSIHTLQEISAEKAHEILKRISDEDCEALGFDVRYARPDWLLMTVFPVPPPPVRPGVMMDSSSRWVILEDVLLRTAQRGDLRESERNHLT